MKNWMKLILLLTLAAALLSACGGKTQGPAADGTPQDPAPAADLDLGQFYADIEKACAWGEDYMVDIEGELLDAYYPGLSELAVKQLVAKAPMMSAVVNEMVFIECETEEDAAKAAEILQARIDYQVGDEENPGGAWYPESIAAWEKGEVIQRGTYAALVASASYQDDIVGRLDEFLA